MRDSIKLSVKVENIGAVAGKDVVQVYVNDKISSVTTPVKVLKGFKKVKVNPNESAIINFLIPCKELGLWDKNMNYVVEPGEFEIMVGASSEDIRLKDSIIITKR
jgi:beta-glucosidase